MLQHKEYKQHLAKEYRYTATKMQQANNPGQKLFYFSVLFAEAQRVLNWEWDRDVALIHAVALHAHSQIAGAMGNPAMGVLAIDWSMIFEQLTAAASDLATYFENTEDAAGELCQILGHIAELAYITGGNGIYLYEKGLIKI